MDDGGYLIRFAQNLPVPCRPEGDERRRDPFRALNAQGSNAETGRSPFALSRIMQAGLADVAQAVEIAYDLVFDAESCSFTEATNTLLRVSLMSLIDDRSMIQSGTSVLKIVSA